MAILIPTSVVNAADHALTVTSGQTQSTLILRDGFHLLADGSGHNGINVNSGAQDLRILIDGYLGSDNAHGIDLNDTSSHGITIGLQGQIISRLDGIHSFSNGNNIMITNNGDIVAGSNAVYLNYSGGGLEPVVVNNGSMAADETAVHLSGGGKVSNSGTLTSFQDGVFFGNGSISTFSNSGTITADDDGIEVNSASFVGSNSGTITGGNRGLEFDLSSDGAAFTNSGVIFGVDDGIFSFGTDTTITNSGSILGSMGIELFYENGLITNEGFITGSAEEGIHSTRGLRVINSGTITGHTRAIEASSSDGTNTGVGDQSVTNSGILSSNSSQAVYLQGTDALVLNSGEILSQDSYGVFLDGPMGWFQTLAISPRAMRRCLPTAHRPWSPTPARSPRTERGSICCTVAPSTVRAA